MLAGLVEKACWLRDLQRFLPSGASSSFPAIRETCRFMNRPGTITRCRSQGSSGRLEGGGYGRIASFDLLNGFRAIEPADDSFLTQLGLTAVNGTAAGGIDLLPPPRTARGSTALPPRSSSTSLLADRAQRGAFAGRASIVFPGADPFAFRARTRPAGERRQPFFNTVIWIVDKEGDLPDWFLIGNPRIRHIPIGKPDHLARRSLVRSLMRSLPGAQAASQDQLRKVQRRHSSTRLEGLLLLDLNAIAQLARSENVAFDRSRMRCDATRSA